jgi:DNA-binding response OmpR family regulator
MSKGRVLLIGGDPDVMRTLRVYLDAHHFSVRTVEGGEAALDAFRQSPPDVVILDWDLPDSESHELCQQLRTYDGPQSAFLVVLLTTDERHARLAALEAGADDVRTHPIDIEEIRLRIEEILRR